jgi:hypothetical protein
LEPGGNVGRLADNGHGVAKSSPAHVADHDQAGMDTEAHLEGHRLLRSSDGM